jgi:Rrf2 family iron-sulfur cluster assembly transcriptional regulator
MYLGTPPVVNGNLVCSGSGQSGARDAKRTLDMIARIHLYKTNQVNKLVTHAKETSKMRLTTKGRYAVRALYCLSRYPKDKPTPLSEVAKSQNISLNFLEQLFVHLRKHGIVTSVRGPRGGYKLNKEPAAISIGEILRAVGESTFPVFCSEDFAIGAKKCPRADDCVTHLLWDKLGANINHFLDTTTLEDIDKLKPL